MSATATAMAASASTMNAANSERISRMKDEQCNLLISSYVAQDANIPEMKAYSSCVERVYPNPQEADIYGFTASQVCFLIVCLFAALGSIYKLLLSEEREWSSKTSLIFEGALLGTLAGSVILVIMLITASVWF